MEENKKADINIEERTEKLEKDEVCQIANGTVHCQTVPATQIRVGNVPALKNPRLLSSGSGFACAVDDDGVSCWGNDYREQLKVP